MSDKSQRTEQATARRQEKARSEGQFPASKEFVSALQFLAFVTVLAGWGGGWMQELRNATAMLIRRAFDRDLNPAQLIGLAWNVTWTLLWPLALLGGMSMMTMLAGQLTVTRFGFSLKKLAPDFNRLNPVTRLSSLPRQNLSAFFQAALMLPIFCWAVYAVAEDRLGAFFTLPLQDVRSGAAQVGASLLSLLWKGAFAFFVFGCIDLFRQTRRYHRDLRMSRQEIKEEHKESEGDPQIKMRIRRLRRELLRRKMMAQVPAATAVIVNPTHYAVAIKYQMDGMSAPMVVAKGRNYLALRIKKSALDHNVPLIENAPLAQALYKSVNVGQEIPAHLYRAVAEILAYIYRLMNGRLPG
jgi:flagellar biosynthesis protein FlhB